MPKTPAELRTEAERWLEALGKHPKLLNRHLFLVPGITDELAGCWQWLELQGRRLIPNWDSYVTVVTFERLGTPASTIPATDFIDFGAYVHEIILRTCGPSGSDSAQFDIVCHSMGGLDTFSCFVPLLGRYPELGPLPVARYLITLDTPWRGVLSWDKRCAQKDISDQQWPGRRTQCPALQPGSDQLVDLTRNRSALAGKVERVVCMSADREGPIEVEWSSSNLFSDTTPQTTWQTSPSYRAHMIPGTCHSGIGGITWSPITIAQIFNYLLFI
jgi:hypothetical protein